MFALETKDYVVDRFDDVGSFATGVFIKHSFAENELNSEMRVAVEKATFADGTVWVNPDVPQSPKADDTVGVAVNGQFLTVATERGPYPVRVRMGE